MKKINKNNPFKTPEGYFDDFDRKLFDKLSGDKTSIPEKDGFVVPETYFETLHENIREKVNSPEIKVISLKSFRKYYYVAASIAAVVLIALSFNWNPSREIGFEDLAKMEIETYFENHELELSTYEIAEVLPIDELEVDDILEDGFDEENMLDYLDENLDHYEELNLEEDE